MKALRLAIEDMRQKLHLLADEKGISHPQTIMMSQKLDELLNFYYYIIYNKVQKTAV